MARFTEDVTVVNRLSGRVHRWEMCEPLTYRLRDDDTSEVVTVAPGFETDFASVPRPLWWWLPPWGRHGRAAIVHDFLYQLGSVTDPVAGSLRRPSRAEADRIFREAMAVLDHVILSRSPLWRRLPAPLFRFRMALAAVRRFLMWAAVALFGRWAYKRQNAVRGGPPAEHDMLVGVAELLAAMTGEEAPSVPKESG
jgi:hypothetical protein